MTKNDFTMDISFLKQIDSLEHSLRQILRKWVNINTYSENPTGLAKFHSLLQAAFFRLGGEMKSIHLPAQKVLCCDGRLQNRPLGKALVLRKRPCAPTQILLGGHIDTVYASNNPFRGIKEKNSEIWNGPGVADMKGGILILLTALQALEQSPFAEKIGWEVLLTPDEELGSPGSGFLYTEAARRHQVGLVFEPSFPDGSFVRARKGSITYSVVIKGRSAHVGRDFHLGRSAVFALARFINKLEKLSIDQDLSINVTEIEGRGPVNIVPSLAFCKVNIRSFNRKILLESLETIAHLAKDSEKEGIQMTVHQDTLRHPKPFNRATESLFQAYESCCEELNIPFQVCDTGGVCDGNILAEAGLPTLDTAGVIGGALHTSDEFIYLSSLIDRAKLAALFLIRSAAGEFKFPQKETHE